MKISVLDDKLKIKEEDKKLCMDNIISYCDDISKVDGIVPIMKDIEIIVCNKDNIKRATGLDVETDKDYNKNILVVNIPLEKRLFIILFIFDYPYDEYYREFSITRVLPDVDIKECKKDFKKYLDELIKALSKRGDNEKFRIR